jgi:hypothetical protein
VFKSYSIPQAELLASALRSMGIDVHVLTFSAANERVPEARVVVPFKDAEDARAAIAELEHDVSRHRTTRLRSRPHGALRNRFKRVRRAPRGGSEP